MKGHIKLGLTVAGLREYMVTDPNAIGMQLSNQMAAKLGSGAGKYDDLQNWSAWVMDNWAAGAGTVDAEGGGFLFGDIDSRVPRQLMLPPAQGAVDTFAADTGYKLTPCDLTSSMAVTLVSRVAAQVYSWTVKSKSVGGTSNYLWVYASIPYGSTVTIAIYDSSNTTLLDTDTFTSVVIDRGHRWHTLSSTYSFVAGTTYTVRMSVNAAWEIHTATQHTKPFFIFQSGGGMVKVIRFNDQLYGTDTTGMYKYNDTTKRWDAMTGDPDWILDLATFNGVLYIGRTIANGNLYTMNTAETFSAGSVTGQHFYKWNGFLYRVVGDSFYYTADGTTWTGPFTAEPGENIQGMAGMGNDLYFANFNGLYRFAPGDIVFGVLQWGKRAGRIGKAAYLSGYTTDVGMPGMVAWQGDIYIAVDGQIVRYTAAGQTSEIWLKDSGDLPALYSGRICALTTMNNYLVACVMQEAGSSVWLWNRQGWHCAGILLGRSVDLIDSALETPGIYSAYYDRTLDRLWVNNYHASMFIRMYDLAQNPYTLLSSATTALFMPSGWVESSWFDGNLIEIKKDFESVYCTGDNIVAGVTEIDIFWKDDDSTDWELLGTADVAREEIRWSTAATRPNSRQLKLALRLRTISVKNSPKLEAVRVKFMSMLADRWRWTLPIAVSLNQEMLDNTLNTYTVAQQIAHIESMINIVPPVFYEDVTGTQYEVKVLGATRAVRDFEYRVPSTAKTYKLVYNLVIEQVTGNI